MELRLEKRAIRTAERKALHTTAKTYGHVYTMSASTYADGGTRSREYQKTEADQLDSILARTTSGNVCLNLNHNRILYTLET